MRCSNLPCIALLAVSCAALSAESTRTDTAENNYIRAGRANASGFLLFGEADEYGSGWLSSGSMGFTEDFSVQFSNWHTRKSASELESSISAEETLLFAAYRFVDRRHTDLLVQLGVAKRDSDDIIYTSGTMHEGVDNEISWMAGFDMQHQFGNYFRLGLNAQYIDGDSPTTRLILSPRFRFNGNWSLGADINFSDDVGPHALYLRFDW